MCLPMLTTHAHILNITAWVLPYADIYVDDNQKVHVGKTKETQNFVQHREVIVTIIYIHLDHIYINCAQYNRIEGHF